jgi:cytoskeletal protein CcmA (bactofilin family)
MASIIKLKRSSTPSSVPSSLEVGELAINLADKKLYSYDGSNIITVAGATADTLTTARTISLTGDISGSVSFDGSQDVSISTTIGANAVALGTDTTGNYVATIAGTAGEIDVSGSGSESAAITLSLPDQITANTSGNAATATALETARTIGGVSFDGTANINLPGVNTQGNQDTTGNAATATALETARNFSLTGDVSASSVSFDGSGNVELTTTIQPNSVALGTDTTGNYVAGISGTANEISVSGSGSENSTVTIGLPDDVTVTGQLNVGENLVVSGNTHIDGNLTVEGSTTYISSSTVNVDDSMLKLSANNAADTVDTGVYGMYIESATSKYAGYFRDASDGAFKFYDGLTSEPGSTVNAAHASYALAQVDAIIDGGTY